MKTRIYFTQDDDIIDIRYDSVFKAVFTRENNESRTALSRLVSAMIGKNVSILKIHANEPPINNTKDRQVRFDINCRTDNGELINVEMSYNPDPFEPVRLEFYTGKLFTGQDIKGTKKDYANLKRTYQIAILAKERVFPDEAFYHTFEYYDSENRVSLNGKSRIITLELIKSVKIVDKPINEMTDKEFWAVFFQYLTDKKKRDKINEIAKYEEGIAMASKVVKSISTDEDERALLLSQEKYILDRQSRLAYERKQREKMIRKAKREALKEGRAEGLNAGREEVLNLLAQGYSVEEIRQRITGSQNI